MEDRKKKKPIARALHEFLGQSEYELTFSTGESVLLLRRIDENWLEGELDGEVGIFPSNRVQFVSRLDVHPYLKTAPLPDQESPAL